MLRNGVLFSAVLAGGMLLCSCGKSSEPPRRSTQVEGSGALAAPVEPAAPDMGILQDPAQYQPANFTPPPSKAKPPPADAAPKAATEASAAAREFALEALEIVQSSKFAPVLDMIDADQVKALREDDATILRTQEAFVEMEQLLKQKLGADVVDELNVEIRKTMADSLQVEMTGPDAATVTPNILSGLFGPEVSGPDIKLVQVAGEWRFELDAPLTDADVAKIAEFHKTLQAAAQQVRVAIEQGQLDKEQILAMVAAMSGQPATGASTGTKPASGPATGPEHGPDEGGQPAP
jgi:hypothetical protein